MELTIKQLAQILRGQFIMGDPKTVATRAEVDSRRIEPGVLFFALKGEKQDGHDYALAACKAGAAGVVVSRLDWMKPLDQFKTAVIRVLNPLEALQNLAHYLRNSFHGPVVGITGSNGKTTTKQMVTSVLKAKGSGLSTRGNFNSQIGLPMVVSEIQGQHQWMVLEMGASEPGNIGKLCEVARPTVGVLTSLGPAHLKTFGSFERIAETKWELMESLPSTGHAIAPWGEPAIERFVRVFKKKLVFFGEDPSCPIRATSVVVGHHIKFLLHVGSQTADVQLPVAGSFNVRNALASAAVGWVLGVPIDKIVEGLENFEPPKMRMEVIRDPSGVLVVNDAYNANPTSMSASIRSLVESYPNKKRVVVLGTMLELGEDSAKYHFHLGTELGRFNIEKAFLVGEEALSVQEGAMSSGADAKKFSVVTDNQELVEGLKGYKNNETVILFKGSRGLQLEKVIEALLGNGASLEKV